VNGSDIACKLISMLSTWLGVYYSQEVSPPIS